ncbi:MAG: glycosyltransferase family 2 protein [Pseudomonadota bacterium]
MKISIIVSTYNRPDTLVKVLDGLLHQTCLPDEIIVADDGSTPDTLHAIESYLSESQPRCIHVWHEDEGFRLAKIRNEAIKASSADYLVFLDGDCIPQRHFVEDHLALAHKGFFFQGKRVIVSQTASPDFSFNDTDSFFCLFKHLIMSRISNGHHIVRMPFLPVYTTSKLSGIRGCNMGFFKQDLLAVNGFNQAFQGWGREDSEIVARLYKYGVKRNEHPFRAICYHLWHKENTRDGIDENDGLLEKTLVSDDHYCKFGIKDA